MITDLLDDILVNCRIEDPNVDTKDSLTNKEQTFISADGNLII